MVSFQFAKLLGQAASGKIIGSAVYKLVALQSVNLFVLLTPFAFFIAVLIGLTKLAGDNELIAMKSVGFSDRKIYQGLFMVAIPLSALILLLTLNVLPNVLSLSYRLTEQAKKESELSVIQPGNFRSIGTNVTLFVADIDDRQFSQFFVWQRSKRDESVTIAETGRQFEQGNDRFIELTNGSRYGWNEKSSQLAQFERFVGLLPEVKPANRAERLKAIPTTTLIDDDTLANRIELQRRMTPAISILLLAVCAPLLVQFNPRENRYGKYVIAILIYAVYLNSQSVFKALIENGKLPIFPGVYTVHLIFAAILLVWLIRHYRRITPPAAVSGANADANNGQAQA